MTWEHLPRDTQAIISQPNHAGACRNLGLMLDRYAPYGRTAVGWEISFRVRESRREGWREQPATGSAAKSWWFTTGQRDRNRSEPIDRPLLEDSRIAPDLLRANLGRWKATAKALRGHGFPMRAASRVVVGLGADCVLEMSLALHRIYGFPVIPGSALKGLARTVALFEVAAELGVAALTPEAYQTRNQEGRGHMPSPLEKLEALLENLSDDQRATRLHSELLRDDALPADAPIRQMTRPALLARSTVRAFLDVFGALGQAGKIVFLDAVPAEPPVLAADVMTPHFVEHYQKKGPPADNDGPNPVSFLTVEAGSLFHFALGLTSRVAEADGPSLLTQAKTWLLQGLQEHGIGAKTGAGYGLWEPAIEERPRVDDATPGEHPSLPRQRTVYIGTVMSNVDKDHRQSTIRIEGKLDDGEIMPAGANQGASVSLARTDLAFRPQQVQQGQRVSFVLGRSSSGHAKAERVGLH